MSLIGSDKVESTPVYGADGRKIGAVQRVMIDKIAARLLMLSFHSAVSWDGRDYYPMPCKPPVRHQSWRLPCRRDGRSVKGAPKYSRITEWDWSDRSKDKAVYDYYRAPS